MKREGEENKGGKQREGRLGKEWRRDGGEERRGDSKRYSKREEKRRDEKMRGERRDDETVGAKRNNTYERRGDSKGCNKREERRTYERKWEEKGETMRGLERRETVPMVITIEKRLVSLSLLHCSDGIWKGGDNDVKRWFISSWTTGEMLRSSSSHHRSSGL